jgi:hypothetical protein
MKKKISLLQQFWLDSQLGPSMQIQAMAEAIPRATVNALRTLLP